MYLLVVLVLVIEAAAEPPCTGENTVANVKLALWLLVQFVVPLSKPGLANKLAAAYVAGKINTRDDAQKSIVNPRGAREMRVRQ